MLEAIGRWENEGGALPATLRGFGLGSRDPDGVGAAEPE